MCAPVAVAGFCSKSMLSPAHNSGYTLRPAGLVFGTFGFAKRRISAERYMQKHSE